MTMKLAATRHQQPNKNWEYFKELAIEARTVKRGLCFICGTRPLGRYADGSLSQTCMGEKCRLGYTPGGNTQLKGLT